MSQLAKDISSVDGGLRFQHFCTSFCLYETEDEVLFLTKILQKAKLRKFIFQPNLSSSPN